MTATRVRARDVVMFAAIVNIHYPLAELASIRFSYGLLPVQLALVGGWAMITGRTRVLVRAIPYVFLGTVYFQTLSAIGVDFYSLGAYVVMMQTTTAIVFVEYLLSLGTEEARALLAGFQRLMGMYVFAFGALVLLVRATGNVVLFNQVAQSNYFGLLTTYLILNVYTGRATARWSATTAAAIAVNALGQQRASFLVNAVLVVTRTVGRRLGVAVLVLVLATGAYVIAGDFLRSFVQPYVDLATAYWALVPLGFNEVEQIIRTVATTPDTGYDASFLLRAASMAYIAMQVAQHPWLPVVSGGVDYLANSHNLLLEYFKVGGLGFVLLSGTLLGVRYRELVRRGIFRLSWLGVLFLAAYSMLSNDLFLGFLLLPLAFPAPRPGTKPAAKPVRLPDDARTPAVAPAGSGVRLARAPLL